MGSPFLHFALGRSHLPENAILFINRPFSARFSNCCNSLNFEVKINFNTTRQNDLKWRKTCTGLKFDLKHLNGPQTKFIGDSLYKHPVVLVQWKIPALVNGSEWWCSCSCLLFVLGQDGCFGGGKIVDTKMKLQKINKMYRCKMFYFLLK